MNLLLQYKGWLVGGGVAIALLMLANHYENNSIREDESQKWQMAIREAKPVETSRDTIRTPQPEIKGEAKNDRQYTPKKHLDVPQIVATVPDSLIDSLDYYSWLLNEYEVNVKDTSGAELDMIAKPRQSTISYVLKLPPKEQINTHIENQVLIPPIEKNWIIGVDMGYHEEARLGGLFGIKPVILGVDYYPEAEKKWGGHIQFQIEF